MIASDAPQLYKVKPAWRNFILSFFEKKFDQEPVSIPYWHRAFRDTCASLIERGKATTTEQDELVETLRSKCAVHVTAHQRRRVKALLVELWVSGLPPVSEAWAPALAPRDPPTVSSAVSWPDAERPADMFTSAGALRLEYVRYIVHRFHEFEVYEIQSRQSTGHIIVEIAEKQLSLAEAALQTLSEAMLAQRVELLPSTVLRFVAKPERVTTNTVGEEDCFASCGNPFRGGSVGGFISLGGQTHMVTAQHVWSTLMTSQPDAPFILQHYLGAKVNDLGLDIALVAASGCECWNHMALLWQSEVEPRIREGESVWKVGAATGLTEGRMSEAVLDNVVANGQRYNRVIKVSWLDDMPFAKGGDCGSFYVVRRGAFYVPVAIHVNSLPGCSIGLSLQAMIEHFPVWRDSDWCFVNPPQAPLPPTVSLPAALSSVLLG